MRDWHVSCVLCRKNLVWSFCAFAQVTLIALYGLWGLMPAHLCFPKWLVSSCFAIYVFHSLIYDVFAISIGWTWIPFPVPAFVPFVSALVGVLCLTFCLRRYSPRLGKLFLGGRC